MSANLYAFRDLDVLLKIQEESDDSGWVETTALAEALGLDEDTRGVGSRLSWMKRYGMLRYDEKRRMWRLTPGAHRVTEAQLKASQARALKELPDEAMVEVMASVTTHYRHASPLAANLLRREFLYGTQPNFRRNGR